MTHSLAGHAQTFHRTHSSSLLSRLAVAAVATLIFTFSGGAPAQASWNTPERPLTASVTAGTMAITQTGFSSLAAVYSSSALTVTGPVTVKNTGSVPAPYSLGLGTRSATALATSAAVNVWVVPAASACTATATASGATGKTWTTVGASTGTLAAGASVVYCIRSSITQSQRFALAGVSATLNSTVSATQGNWNSSSTASATQTVADSVTPGQTSKTSETDSSISLSWTAPTDTAAISGYQVVRDGVVVATLPASRLTYTDSGLDVLKYYTYTVRSTHTATPVDVSPLSPAVAHATAWFTYTNWYSVRNVSSQLCVTGADGGTVAGSALVSSACSNQASQSNKFVVDASNTSYVNITPKSSASLFWDSPSDDSSILRTSSNISAQKWQILAIGSGTGTFTLQNKNNDCLDVSGNNLGSSTQVRVAACDGSANQTFILKNMG
ncbi:RICIN domain-containing protein [Agreia sp. COWG]|uniref:RICIN domain-containing protein n=1 Tax=Agreia sp. COWG TaxID=2773266 RepID=UPI00192632C5|nr:RICIN domain-containing protein [Agreia sp. COWG]CAD5994923.1 conserved exported protein of unknown function [Agreia sp. COWG]